MPSHRKKRVRTDLNPFRKQRDSHTDEDKKELRKHHQKDPSLKHKDLIEWFLQRTGKRVTQGLISQWLSDKYVHLDDLKLRPQDPRSYRQRQAKWPLIEAPLFEFQQKMQRANLPCTEDLLKETARRLWEKIPEYKDLATPAFSNGYIDGFKMRFKIKRYKKFRESESAPLEESEPLMEKLREISRQYPMEDQYNMDETGLFWKLIPDSGLATEQQHGRKIEKIRLTIALTSNADGSRKLDPWIINKFLNPRCFGRDGAAIKGRPLHWRANKKAWMITSIMLEYLKWFDRQMSKPTLLLLDGFSAHECAINTLKDSENPPFQLRWTRVEFLPPNTTSHWQPMDQGIIKAFKAYYKKMWLQFMVDCVEQDINVLKQINLCFVVRWILLAWNKVAPKTIENCWIKSTVLGRKQTVEKAPKGWEPEQNFVDEAEQLLKELQQKKVIKEKENLDSILNPAEEVIEDLQGDIFDQVVDIFIPEELEEEDSTPPVKIKEKEVLEMLQRLQLYEESQEEKNNKLLFDLSRYERDVRGRMARNRPIQAKIDEMFTKKTSSEGIDGNGDVFESPEDSEMAICI